MKRLLKSRVLQVTTRGLVGESELNEPGPGDRVEWGNGLRNDVWGLELRV